MEIDYSWKEKELEKERRGGRRYLHFDSKVSVDAYFDRVCSPKWVSRRGFLPFLHITIDTPRVRFSAKENRRVFQRKPREIYFASHVDSLVFSYYAWQLQMRYEEYLKDKPGISEAALAYRSLGKNNLHFAKQVFDWIKALNQPLVALCFDIKSFFDNMDHAILLDNWKTVEGIDRLEEDAFQVFRANTQFAWVEDRCVKELFPLENGKGYQQRLCSPMEFREVVRAKKLIQCNQNGCGVPQGSPISAVLSNLYMLDLDAAGSEFALQYGALYRRYSDDILIVCEPQHQAIANEMLKYHVAQLKLTLSVEKTDVTHFDLDEHGALQAHDGKGNGKRMQYLGVEFDGKRPLLRSSSLSRYHRKRVKAVKLAIGRTIGNKSRGDQVFLRKLFMRYSHLGRANFIAYAYRASEILESRAIRKQVGGNLETLVKLTNMKRGRVGEERVDRRERDLRRARKRQ